MTTATLKRNITKMVRQSVKETIAAEMMYLRASLLPPVSVKEQREIERKYGKPSRKGVRSIRVSL